MKTSNKFQQVIQEHLNFRAFGDPLFAITLAKPNKNIEDCCTYILNRVKASGENGFEDEEIFAMAVHYYDEDDLKPGSLIQGKVVVNHKIDLSSDDIAQAKQKAMDQVIKEERERILKKPTATKPTVKAPAIPGVINLFE